MPTSHLQLASRQVAGAAFSRCTKKLCNASAATALSVQLSLLDARHAFSPDVRG